MDIASWLRDLRLERYEQAFRNNEIDLAVLPELDDQDLRHLGVSVLGHRKKLLRAIAKLGSRDVLHADLLIAEAREVIASGNTVARWCMLGAIVWWFANLLPVDLSEGATGAPSKRLEQLQEHFNEATKACERKIDLYSDSLTKNDGALAECVNILNAESLKSDDPPSKNVVLPKLARLTVINDQLDNFSDKCDLTKWHQLYEGTFYEGSCETKRKNLATFVSQLTAQGTLDVAGLKISNIHPKWHALTICAIILFGGLWIGSKRRKFFQILDEIFQKENETDKKHSLEKHHHVMAVLPWWLWPTPTWTYGSKRYKFYQLLASEKEYRSVFYGFATILFLMFGISWSALYMQQKNAAFMINDNWKYLLEKEQESNYRPFSITGSVIEDLILLGTLLGLTIVVFYWIFPPRRSAAERAGEDGFFARRILLKQGLVSAAAIALTAVATPLLLDHERLMRMVRNPRFRRPVRVATYDGSVGWYSYPRPLGQPAWIGHFVRPKFEAVHPDRENSKDKSNRPSGTIGGAGTLTAKQLESLAPLSDRDLPKFDRDEKRKVPHLNTSYYSEGIEYVAIKAWNARAQIEAIAMLRAGLTYVQVGQDPNFRLYDLLAGLLVRSGREAELADQVKELQKHLDRFREPATSDLRRQIALIRLGDRIARWSDPSSRWRHSWRSDQGRRWNAIDI